MREFITGLHMRAEFFTASPALRALNDHACDWLLTIDCLHSSCGGGLALADAIRVADAGFRGDNIRAARRVLATLNKGT